MPNIAEIGKPSTQKDEALYKEQAVSKEEILESIQENSGRAGPRAERAGTERQDRDQPAPGPQKFFIVYGRAQSMRPGKRRRRIHHADGCAV